MKFVLLIWACAIIAGSAMAPLPALASWSDPVCRDGKPQLTVTSAIAALFGASVICTPAGPSCNYQAAGDALRAMVKEPQDVKNAANLLPLALIAGHLSEACAIANSQAGKVAGNWRYAAAVAFGTAFFAAAQLRRGPALWAPYYHHADALYTTAQTENGLDDSDRVSLRTKQQSMRDYFALISPT